VAQGDAEFLEQGFAQVRVVLGADQEVDQFVERLGQIAVVIERLDQESHQGAIPIRHLGHADLGTEVFAQGRGRGLGLAAVHVVVVGIALHPAAGEAHAPAFIVTGASLGGVVAELLGLACCWWESASPAWPSANMPGSPGSSRSSRGFSCKAWSISALSSSVESCNNRIDCCNCGVKARCWESLSWSPCFMTSCSWLYILKCSPR
jgi:hypothetical protein